MLPTLRISLASLVLLLPLGAGSASAQNPQADDIRLMCLDRAATWKDFNPEFPHASEPREPVQQLHARLRAAAITTAAINDLPLEGAQHAFAHKHPDRSGTRGDRARRCTLAGDRASAEDGGVYGIRDQCIDQVGGGYAGIYGNAESNYAPRTLNVYCELHALARDASLTQIVRTGAKISAALIAAACLFASGGAFADDAPLEGIQQMCLDRAGSSWTDFNPMQGHGRARTNIYSSCMVDHGLRP